MEFLICIEVGLPPDFDEARKQELTRAEVARARALAEDGTIVRLWRIPGRWANVGVWNAEDASRLHEAIRVRRFRSDGRESRDQAISCRCSQWRLPSSLDTGRFPPGEQLCAPRS